jgi:hypothetical protein
VDDDALVVLVFSVPSMRRTRRGLNGDGVGDLMNKIIYLQFYSPFLNDSS